MISIPRIRNFLTKHNVIVSVITVTLTDQLIDNLDNIIITFIFPLLGIDEKFQKKTIKLGKTDINFGEFISKVIHSLIILTMIALIVNYLAKKEI